MAWRVALVGIYHESNSFISTYSEADDFRSSHWLWGEGIRSEYREAHHEIGGMLEVLEEAGVEVVPVMFAEATPGGIVSDAAYRALFDGLLQSLQGVLPVDGCLVVPHGAAVNESEADMDGHWLTAVRDLLGTAIPIVGTLDLHANISKRMAQATDACVVYKRNPHLDQRERGREAASLLLAQLRGEVRLVQHLRQLPMAISIEQQWTDVEPCKAIYQYTLELEQEPGVLSVSVALGFPYADVHEMGTSVVVVTDGDEALAEQVANRMGRYLLERADDFVGPKISVNAAMANLSAQPKPALLLDMGDNIGGGTPGNGFALVQALEAAGYRYVSYQPDAEAVRRAKDVSVGEMFEICLTGFVEHGPATWRIDVTLIERVDGKFMESTPKHGGQVRFDMGETLILRTPGGGTLLVSTLRIPPFSAAQLTAFGLDPRSFDVIVAKGVNAPIAAYGPFCASIIQVDTPGPSRADMTKLTYERRRRPLFPFEDVDA